MGSVTITSVSAGRGQKTGRATVVVRDDVDALVEGATINGEFIGDINEELSDVSDANGNAVFDTSTSWKGGITLEFCVNTITHPDLADYAGGPVCSSL